MVKYIDYLTWETWRMPTPSKFTEARRRILIAAIGCGASRRTASRVAGIVGETGARELLDVLTRSEADRAALIGRLSLRADAEWLAELLIDP
jgi:hypothetical protein